MARNCTNIADAAKAGIGARAETMRAQAEAVWAENVDGIHDMRVASRRLRAALSEYRPTLDSKAVRALSRRVRQVTRTLGRPRELDVMIATMMQHQDTLHGEAQTAASHALRRLRARRRAVAMSCREAAGLVSSPAFDELLQAVLTSAAPSRECLLEHARERLTDKYERLCRAYAAWKQNGREERLHEIRVDFKKLRYACEVYVECYGARMTRFLAQLKEVQQLLGAWNDLRVLRVELADIAWDLPERTRRDFPALIAAIGAPCAALETEFAAHAEQFFSKSRRRSARQLFQTPKASCCRE